ncbi:MAG: hypothetical protein ACAH95_14410 [Fimbriimonas sp.]
MNGFLLFGTLLLAAWLASGAKSNAEDTTWRRFFRVENRVFLALLLGPALYFGRMLVGESDRTDLLSSASVVSAMIIGSVVVAAVTLMGKRKQIRRRGAVMAFAAAGLLPLLAGLRIHVAPERTGEITGLLVNCLATDLYIVAIVSCSIWIAIFEEWPFVSLAASALCAFIAGYLKFGSTSSQGELFTLGGISTCGALLGLATSSALFGGMSTRKFVVPGVAFWCACLTIIIPVKRVLLTSMGGTALFFGLPIAIAIAEALRIWVRRSRPVAANGTEVNSTRTYAVVSAVGLTLLNLAALFWVIAR